MIVTIVYYFVFFLITTYIYRICKVEKIHGIGNSHKQKNKTAQDTTINFLTLLIYYQTVKPEQQIIKQYKFGFT